MQNQKGFTFVELLIVTLIIGFLTVAFIVNVRKGEKKTALLRTSQDLILQIRKVQNYVLTGEKLISPSGIKVCGYGIYKESDTGFIIYQEKLTDILDKCSSNPSIDFSYTPGTDEIVYRYEILEKDLVKIETPNFDLYFVSPFSNIYFNGNNLLAPYEAELSLCLREDCLNFKSKIIITSGGAIYAKE